jgi:predicted CoA-binding protein
MKTAKIDLSEILSSLHTDINALGISNEQFKNSHVVTDVLEKIMDLHEVISVKEGKKKEDICILCEEIYPCETVEIIFNGFGYSIK